MSILELSFWSIIPPLLTIALVIKTREVIVSMCIGIALGCMLLADLNPLRALETFVNTMIGVLNEDNTILPGSITESENCMVILSMIMIGAMIGLLVKSGAPVAVAEEKGSRGSSL